MYTKDRVGIQRAYKDILTKKYVGNPELARILRNYINELRRLAFKDSSDIYNWVRNTGKALNLVATSDYEAMIEVITFNLKALRAEYDEEWVESSM